MICWTALCSAKTTSTSTPTRSAAALASAACMSWNSWFEVISETTTRGFSSAPFPEVAAGFYTGLTALLQPTDARPAALPHHGGDLERGLAGRAVVGVKDQEVRVPLEQHGRVAGSPPGVRAFQEDGPTP